MCNVSVLEPRGSPRLLLHHVVVGGELVAYGAGPVQRDGKPRDVEPAPQVDDLAHQGYELNLPWILTIMRPLHRHDPIVGRANDPEGHAGEQGRQLVFFAHTATMLPGRRSPHRRQLSRSGTHPLTVRLRA